MKKWGVRLLIVLMAAAIAACGANEKGNTEAAPSLSPETTASAPNESPQDETIQAEQAASGKSTNYPITVKDATGEEVTLDKAPERIVSVSPSETEILYALGLADRVYGVSDFDNYPPEVAEKPRMGSVTKPNEEAIIASNADLVIGGISMKDDVAEKFRTLGIKLYKTEPKTVRDVLDNIRQIGVMTDSREAAEALIAKLEDDIRRVQDAVATLAEDEKKKVYIEFAPGWTVGRGEYLDELITLAGGINIAADLQGWVKINEEKVIQDNPDVIFYAANLVDDNSGKTLEELIRLRSGWDKITAMQENRLVALDQDMLARPSPRITQGLLDIAAGIYPELVQP